MLSAAVAAPLAVRNHPPYKSGEELLDEALFLARATIATTKIQN